MDADPTDTAPTTLNENTFQRPTENRDLKKKKNMQVNKFIFVGGGSYPGRYQSVGGKLTSCFLN